MKLGYARVSKEEQADSLPAQVARLQAAGCDRIVQEMESGRNDDRPGLAEVVAQVRTGKITELTITRADRLGRNAAFADELLALCAIAGVKVVALDGGTIESATPQGFLQARLLTTMAEVESRMLSLRIRSQFDQYRAQGRHLRRRKPFGYRNGPDHKLEPDPEQWPQALKVLERLRELGSFSKTIRDLPGWCEWTPGGGNLLAWFINPVIRGHIGHKLDKASGKSWGQRWGEIHYDQHPALIGEADWQELADHLRRPTNQFLTRSNGGEARHALTGLLRCGACGHTLRRNASGSTGWWRCRHRLCDEHAVVREDRALADVVAACIDAADRLTAAVASPQTDSPAVAAKRRDLEALEALAKRNPAIVPACDALRVEIGAMTSRPQIAPDLEKIRGRLVDPDLFRIAVPAHLRSAFSAVLQEVRVKRDGSLEAIDRL
jgi:DNA invertase Pin-like site-specific DNA recombinase